MQRIRTSRHNSRERREQLRKDPVENAQWVSYDYLIVLGELHLISFYGGRVSDVGRIWRKMGQRFIDGRH